MAQSDGSIVFSTQLDNGDLDKQLRDTERKIDDLKRKIDSKTTSRNALAEQIKGVENEMELANRAIERMQARLVELRSSKDPMSAAREQVVSSELSKQFTLYDKLIDKATKLDEKWDAAERELIEYNHALGLAQDKYSSLAAQSQQATQQAAPQLRKAGDTMNERFNNVANNIRQRMAGAAQQSVSPWRDFAKRVNAMLKKVFVFGVILSGLRSIKNAVSSMLMENTQFNASVQNLKSIMSGFLAQMVQSVLPVLTGIVNTLAAAFEKVASFIDNLFGTNIMGNIARQRNDAHSAIQRANAEKMAEYNEQVAQERERYEKQLAQAQERQAKAAQKLEKAQKKANAQLLAFDELNKLAEESSDDAADAVDDYTDSIEEPDYSSIQMPELETDWTDALDPSQGLFQNALDWLDKIRDRILNDVAGPFARIREGLQLIKQGWDELMQGIQNGDWAMVWKGIGDIVIGALYVIEGAFGALMDWLDDITGGRFHEIFEGMKLTVHGFVEVIEGLLRGDLPLTFQGLLDILDGVTLTAEGIVTAIANFFRDTVNNLFDFLEEKMPVFKGPLENLRTFAIDTIGAVEKFMRDRLEGGAQFIRGILEIVTGLFTLNAESIQRGITDLFDGFKRTLNGVVDFGKNLTGNALDLLRNTFNGFFDFLSEKFPFLSGLFQGLKHTIEIVIYYIRGVIFGVIEDVMTKVNTKLSGMSQILRGAVDVVAGIFTGCGERVVQGLKSIVNGFITIVEGILDSVIGGVVTFVNNITEGLNNIPGVYVQPTTFYGVRLPRLAQGAVIPPNREFMAVLGDQASGNNIETPEALMRQVVREETGPLLADVVAALLNNGGGQGQDVVLMVGRKELARETIRGIRELDATRELGGSGLAFS